MIQVWTGVEAVRWGVSHYDGTFHSLRDPVSWFRPVYRILHEDYRRDVLTVERLGPLRSWWYWRRGDEVARRMRHLWRRA